MKKSSEYQKFMKWLDSCGREKLDGYGPDLFDHIDPGEREELEDIIWQRFNNASDYTVACYLPQLTRYDGIRALQEKLSACTVPGRRSTKIAKVLYEATGDDSYLDVFKENYEKTDQNRYMIVAELSFCKPGQKMFDLLCDIYLNGDEDLSVQSAAWGILFYIKGLDPYMPWAEQKTYLPVIRRMTGCEKTERAEQLRKIQTEQTACSRDIPEGENG